MAGCFNAAVTGAQAVYNHDSLQKTINDQYITMQAYDKLRRYLPEFQHSNISVSSFHEVVLLTGQTPSNTSRQQAEKIVKRIPDIEKIYNFIHVSPISTPAEDLQDTWITTQIKTKIIAENDLDPSQIKVVTDHGTVFLMGTVLMQQADTAAYLARTTDGVEKVVKIFTYLQICKVKNHG